MRDDVNAVRFIVDQPAWYGCRSGYYAQLPRAMARLGHRVRTVTPCSALAWRAVGRAWSLAAGLPRRRQTLTIDELRFHAGWIGRQDQVAVILAMEQHLPALRYWSKAPARLVGTLHHPREYWTDAALGALKRLRSAVVLYRADLEFFAEIVGRDHVRVARHGVDTEFFQPATGGRRAEASPSLLCVGQFGRDFAQLARVGPTILEALTDAHLDIVVASFAAGDVPASLLAHPRVRLHRGLTDEQLRERYQSAALMLLPLHAAGANNAVVEALACGLPIVATDVGGVRDYGGGRLFPIVPRGDDRALVTTVVDLARDDRSRAAIARAARTFAVATLSWDLVAADHWRVYQELAAEAA